MADRAGSEDVRVFRALSSDVRSRLLELLRAEPDLDTAELAKRMSLHANTVRSHLGVLEDADLVSFRLEERNRPGRPRRLFRATDAQRLSSTDGDGYRFLAQVLASYLSASVADPAAAAAAAGTAWGGHVVERPPPFQPADPSTAVQRLTAMLTDLGFAPELDETDPQAPRVRLRRCPFLDVAREHQEVVCSVHLGLMRGALTELGVDVETEDLIPFAEPDACVAHLRMPT